MYDSMPRLSARISPGELRHFKELLESELVAPDSPVDSAANLPQAGEQLIEEITYVLLLDRYPIGVWGRSLAKSVAAYGHRDDLGSITVSWWVLEALSKIYGERSVLEIDSFKSYLDQRRTASGAIGIRMNVASGWAAPTYQIIEHCRHTAIAAIFYWKYGHSLDRALQCLRFVIGRRTPNSAWPAVGDAIDDQADPLTTAYVLRTLLDFDAAGLLGSIDFDGRRQFCANYKALAISWLQDHLVTNDFHWVYKRRGDIASPEILRKIYSYTADILAMVPEFPGHSDECAESHSTTVRRLAELWRTREGGIGIPDGLGDLPASLETTALYTLSLWRCRERYPHLAHEFTARFMDNLGKLMEDGNCTASGMAVVLRLLIELEGCSISEEVLDRSRILARETWRLHQEGNSTAVARILENKSSWVTAVSLRILGEKASAL